MLTLSGVRFLILNIKFWCGRYSSNSSCVIHWVLISVIAMFLGRRLAISSWQNVWNFLPIIFSSSTKTTESTQPHTQDLSVVIPFSDDSLYYRCHFTGYHKHLPNLVNASWLCRIRRGIWAKARGCWYRI